jgi:hypothetical protein
MKTKIAVACGLTLLGAGALAVHAQVTAPVPGVMTEARVYIQNRGRGEAVPVVIDQADPLSVRLAGPTSLTVAAGTTVQTRLVRQAWEYQTVRVTADQDPVSRLNAAGADGWDAVGVFATDQTGVTFVMKRPAAN